MGEKYTYGEFHCPWDGCDHESPSKQGLGTHFKRTHGETLREYQRKHRNGDYPCPSCDDIFDTDRGLKVHHARIHGESIAGVEIECAYCGTPKTVAPDRITRYNAHYCNNECRAKDSRKRLDVNCHYCGDEFEIAEWHYNQTEKVFCPGSTCYGDWISENLRGEAHPRWQEGLPRTVPCSNCGKALERRPERILNRSEESSVILELTPANKNGNKATPLLVKTIPFTQRLKSNALTVVHWFVGRHTMLIW